MILTGPAIRALAETVLPAHLSTGDHILVDDAPHRVSSVSHFSLKAPETQVLVSPPGGGVAKMVDLPIDIPVRRCGPSGERILISPFDTARCGPASYDVHLGNEIRAYVTNPGQPIDPRDPPPTAAVPLGQHGRWLIQPGTVYLGVTKEYTETEKLVPMLHGRSSIGRYGLFIHVTAGVGDPGFRGNFTLELVATQPVYVYPDMKIGQLTYHQVSGEDQPYAGRYQGDKTPVASRYHLPEKR